MQGDEEGTIPRTELLLLCHAHLRSSPCRGFDGTSSMVNFSAGSVGVLPFFSPRRKWRVVLREVCQKPKG